MNNIKGMAIVTDGNMKRVAITYDKIDDEGKVVDPNVKINRVVTDKDALAAIAILEEYAQTIVDAN